MDPRRVVQVGEGSTATVALRLRNESSPQELRAVITPDDARKLIAAGVTLTVEESPQRIFPTAEYEAAGARIAPADSWGDAPADEIVVGLKAPGPLPSALRHRHVFFGHAYKGQQGGEALLRRFVEGGGTLLDLEYLTDDSGRRVAAFGYWAGYVGAALAALHARGNLVPPLRATSRAELDEALGEGSDDQVRALVIGALGRSGQGAVAALSVAGMAVTAWDLAETRRLDRAAVLGHDVLVNTVLTQVPAPPFVRPEDLDDPHRRLTVISDVTCDVTSECNLLPIYDRTTDWAQPVRRLRTTKPLDLIAIDNLPSMLPREASTAFSADLLPHLLTLGAGSPVWRRAHDRFVAASAALYEELGRKS
ncbi:saccharopine dehydrogenase [Micromonospora sp. NPDC049891]|uniref:saccharopine dehydrogenase n=1 Tax=Micromonospora sp. NPDC049891 TaxID=3155655 RepID=UPI0033C90527